MAFLSQMGLKRSVAGDGSFAPQNTSAEGPHSLPRLYHLRLSSGIFVGRVVQGHEHLRDAERAEAQQGSPNRIAELLAASVRKRSVSHRTKMCVKGKLRVESMLISMPSALSQLGRETSPGKAGKQFKRKFMSQFTICRKGFAAFTRDIGHRSAAVG